MVTDITIEMSHITLLSSVSTVQSRILLGWVPCPFTTSKNAICFCSLQQVPFVALGRAITQTAGMCTSNMPQVNWTSNCSAMMGVDWISLFDVPWPNMDICPSSSSARAEFKGTGRNLSRVYFHNLDRWLTDVIKSLPNDMYGTLK